MFLAESRMAEAIKKWNNTKKKHGLFVSSRKSTTFALGFEKPADMAQLVEQRIRNAWVRGSSPRVGSHDEQTRRCQP